jgi:hypothetical protein
MPVVVHVQASERTDVRLPVYARTSTGLHGKAVQVQDKHVEGTVLMLEYTRYKYNNDWENMKILRNNFCTNISVLPERGWYRMKVEAVDLLGFPSNRLYYPGACAWFHRMRSLWNPPLDGDNSRRYYYKKYKDVMMYDMMPTFGAGGLSAITGLSWCTLLSKYGRE